MRTKPLKSFLYEFYPSILIALAMTAISLLLQTNWCDSMMRQSEEIWQRRIDIHLTEYPFSTRYFANYSTLFINWVTGWPLRESYFVVQFILFLLCGPALFSFLRGLKIGRNYALLGELIFYFMYPVIAAHIQPVFTWDDFFVYLFLILSLNAVFWSRPIIGAIFFTLTLYAREQSIFLFPVYILTVLLNRNRSNSIGRSLIWILATAVLYAPYYLLVHLGKKGLNLDHFTFNFEYALRSSDTIFSFLIAFGFVWLTSAITLRGRKYIDNDRIRKFLTFSYIYLVPVTILAVLFLARGRETRLFFPPFVILIPMSVFYLKNLYENTIARSSHKTLILLSSGSVVLIAVGVWLGWMVFPHFDFRACSDFARNAIGFNIGVCLIILMLIVYSKFNRKQKSITDH